MACLCDVNLCESNSRTLTVNSLIIRYLERRKLMLITQDEKFKSLKGKSDNLTKNIDLTFL